MIECGGQGAGSIVVVGTSIELSFRLGFRLSYSNSNKSENYKL